VTNSSMSMRHPTSRTHDLRDHLGGAQVGHLPDAVYGALLDRVKQMAPRLLAELRDQAAEAAKAARATARYLASDPQIQTEFVARALGLEREADRAGRAAILVKAALDRQQRRPAETLTKAVFVDGPDEPETRVVDGILMEPIGQWRKRRRGQPPGGALTKAATPTQAAASAIAGLRAQAAELRRRAAYMTAISPAQERRLLAEALTIEREAADLAKSGAG
jgi:hypothetical protein